MKSWITFVFTPASLRGSEACGDPLARQPWRRFLSPTWDFYLLPSEATTSTVCFSSSSSSKQSVRITQIFEPATIQWAALKWKDPREEEKLWWNRVEDWNRLDQNQKRLYRSSGRSCCVTGAPFGRRKGKSRKYRTTSIRYKCLHSVLHRTTMWNYQEIILRRVGWICGRGCFSCCSGDLFSHLVAVDKTK